MANPVTTGGNPLYQSPWLYIQAAGSDESDGTVSGIQLRWDLTRNLGSLHIPQGEHGVDTGSGFSKTEDFVELYRAIYEQEFACVVDLQTPPDVVYEQGEKRYWRYNNFVPVPSHPLNYTHVVIRFTDKDHYDAVRSQYDPTSDPFNFFNNYNQLIEVQATGKLMFEVAFQSNSARIRTEAISLPPDQLPQGLHVSNRSYLTGEQEGQWKSVVEEHIKYVRFVRDSSTISKIKVVTYHDTMLGYDDSFELVDLFGLTTKTDIALARLNAGGMVHGNWPKYNDGATINVNNYEERWEPQNSAAIIGEGIKNGVEKYLSLSEAGDPSATEEISDADGNLHNVSYLELLKFASVDYHVARILGLGHIETEVSESKYIHLAKYFTLKDPGTGSGSGISHLSLTIPTAKRDYRLPPQPKIKEITFGLFSANGTVHPSNFADDNGYDYFSPVRYVNLYRKTFRFEMPLLPFYQDDAEFSLAKETLVAQFGVEYTGGEGGGLVAPELLHDDYFLDPGGINETVAIPYNGDPVAPVFTHHETYEGSHTYGLYTINWFSRASAVSPMVDAGDTVFSDRCKLMPPSNLSVQLIQPEDPLILTTAAEQAMLGDDYDKVLLRATFEWNLLQIDQYLPDSANVVEFFFRELPPMVLQGQITGATDLGNGKASVTINNPPSQGTLGEFVGSLLVTNGTGYHVESIDGSALIVRQVKSTTPVNASNDNNFFVSEQFTMPSGHYTLAENLAAPGNWDQQLGFTVAIPGAVLNLSGPVAHPDITGLYKFTIGALPLPPAVVQWNKGSVFMDNGPILQVWRLDEVAHEILAFDPESTNPGYVGLIATHGKFYPGFKIYMEESHGLNKTKILPQGGESQQMTYLGARARDTAKNCSSPVTTPAVILAHELQKPEQPQILAGPVFTTRPDFYGKATYTFDVQVNTQDREPYALAFCRADAQKVLSLLYRTSTVESILNNPDFLPGLNNPGFTTLWSDFINGNGLGNFIMPDNHDYIIPVPDPSLKNKPFDGSIPYTGSMEIKLYYNPDGSLVTVTRHMQQIIQDAIVEAFVPLTPQPLVYRFIKEAAGELVTYAVPPVIMNDLGEPLSPGHPDFNPYPMAIRFEGNKVRFTDYTIDGSSLSFYFYFAIELSNRLTESDRSPVVGPIQLVNAFPPEAVAIKKVTVQTANPLFNIPAGVRFEVNQFVGAENIKRFQIFRSTTPQEALSVRTMTLANTLEAGQPLTDDFSDLDFPPFGEPVYYRIVALREIINEENDIEYVPSEPSNTALASIIDVSNPQAPELSYTGTLTGPEILNVHITWSKTVHNGIYYLYKMNRFGNWVKIYQLETNQPAVNVDLADTALASGTLEKEIANGDIIYHHFKVMAENASGLLSLDERVLTV